MTTFLLIRHGAHNLGGHVIAGRSDAAELSDEGIEQVSRLAGRIAAHQPPVRWLYTSPVLRTRQTAGIISERLRLAARENPGLAEIDFGQWTGKRLDELENEPAWRRWNAFRSGAAAPGGESMLQVQSRIVHEMLRLAPLHDGETVALVSHGDVIKSAVAYFLGVPLDLMPRIEIGVASVSTIALAEGGPWVLGVNGNA